MRVPGNIVAAIFALTIASPGRIRSAPLLGFIDELNHPGGGIVIPPGTYTIRAESQKYGVVSQTVTVQANKVIVIPLEKK